MKGGGEFGIEVFDWSMNLNAISVRDSNLWARKTYKLIFLLKSTKNNWKTTKILYVINKTILLGTKQSPVARIAKIHKNVPFTYQFRG